MTAASSNKAELSLYRGRFVGRDDVFAQRWTSARSGKTGWSPVVRTGFYTAQIRWMG